MGFFAALRGFIQPTKSLGFLRIKWSSLVGKHGKPTNNKVKIGCPRGAVRKWWSLVAAHEVPSIFKRSQPTSNWNCSKICMLPHSIAPNIPQLETMSPVLSKSQRFSFCVSKNVLFAWSKLGITGIFLMFFERTIDLESSKPLFFYQKWRSEPG